MGTPPLGTRPRRLFATAAGTAAQPDRASEPADCAGAWSSPCLWKCEHKHLNRVNVTKTLDHHVFCQPVGFHQVIQRCGVRGRREKPQSALRIARSRRPLGPRSPVLSRASRSATRRRRLSIACASSTTTGAFSMSPGLPAPTALAYDENLPPCGCLAPTHPTFRTPLLLVSTLDPEVFTQAFTCLLPMGNTHG